MEVIITVVKDLLKHKVTSYVDTGDRIYDNLLISAWIALIGFFFSASVYNPIKNWFYTKYLFVRYTWEGCNENPMSYYAYMYFLNKDTSHFNSKINNPTPFFVPLVKYMSSLKFGISTKNLYINENGKLTEPSVGMLQNITQLSTIMSVISSLYEGVCPIFIYNRKVLYIKKEPYSIKFLYEDIEVYDEFMKLLSMSTEKTQPTSVKVVEKCIIDRNGVRHTIYTDRCFDQIISKHKSKLINYLNNFQHAMETGKSKFNGMGSYNLGIMLYGVPGTGKTSVIKAVCNYLQRDAIIIDMKRQKTSKNFEDLFTCTSGKMTDYVYVLDEFDCIKGVIESRDNDGEKDNSMGHMKKELQDRYMKLLEIQRPDDKTITDELVKVRKEMDELTERLTLDTMLTVLDGSVEMRGRVIIACTNYVDHIDKALVRGGRFDILLEMDRFNRVEMLEMIELMFPEQPKESYININFPEGKYTPVEIINICHVHQEFDKIIGILSS